MPPRIIVSEETKRKLREASGTKDKYAEFDTAATADGFRWSGVNSNVLAGCVAAVTGAGDCISFSVTSDGGAGVITVLSSGAPFKRYPASEEAAEDHLKRLTAINTPAKTP
jgi:hypothetical protein